MNRRDFMKAAAAVAGGMGVGGSNLMPVPDSFRLQIRAIDNASPAFNQVGVVAGESIWGGWPVYIADNGMAYVGIAT